MSEDVKQITVAVTGHRDMIETDLLYEQINLFFDDLLKNYDEVILLSPLAQGADQYVAKIFMDKQVSIKKSKLIVPMPLNKKEYIKDFSHETRMVFDDLAILSSDVFCIPQTPGNVYENLGQYIVDASDVLLALWDGHTNNKLGGTGSVVAYAKAHEHKVVHLQCERKNF